MDKRWGKMKRGDGWLDDGRTFIYSLINICCKLMNVISTMNKAESCR